MDAQSLRTVPRIVVHDPEVLRDPIGVYSRAREESPVVRVLALGLPPKWAVTRFADARAMFADPRFRFAADSAITPDVPEAGRVHLRATLIDHRGHRWFRASMAKTFTPRRATQFRPKIEAIVDELLDDLPGRAEGGAVDLIRHFIDPLPIDVTCEFLGIPRADRFTWREYPEPVGSGVSERFAAVMPSILEQTRSAIAYRRANPGDDVISVLTAEADAPGAVELEGLVWINVIASSTVAGLLGSAVPALLTHPGELDAVRSGAVAVADAIDELVRWCGLHVLSTPRYAVEDAEISGITIPAGAAVVACVAAANRDPRAFAEPERLDLRRAFAGSPPHLGFAHGPHGCAGNPLGRMIVDVALTRLLSRYPRLALAVDPADLQHAADPETWRVEALPVTL